MESNLIDSLAQELMDAEKSGKAITRISERYPNITFDEAVSINHKIMENNIAQGTRVIGKKIGLTSKSIQQQAGVFEPDLGYVYDNGVINNGGVLDSSKLIVPSAETEIAFVLKKDLLGPVVLPVDVIKATEGILPALEIIDTRYGVWNFAITDTVADNASYARIVLGNTLTPIEDIDLSLLGMVTWKNGEILCTGAGGAVMGNPIHAVTWLANKMIEYGDPLRKGEIILSGAFTGAYPIEKGDVIEAKFDRVGSVMLKVE